MISVSTENSLAPSVKPKTIGYAVQRLVTSAKSLKLRSSLRKGHAPKEVEQASRLARPQRSG